MIASGAPRCSEGALAARCGSGRPSSEGGIAARAAPRPGRGPQRRAASPGARPGAASPSGGLVPRGLTCARPALARFLVRRVLAAPAAVLAELDPVRIVALGLLGLVVAPLALLAGEGHGDSDVSAGHRLPRLARPERSARRRSSASRTSASTAGSNLRAKCAPEASRAGRSALVSVRGFGAPAGKSIQRWGPPPTDSPGSLTSAVAKSDSAAAK